MKWFDPRRSYGFCTTDESEEDIFFGAAEAKAAHHRGLTLSRGESLLCDIVEDCTRANHFSAVALRPGAPKEFSNKVKE